MTKKRLELIRMRLAMTPEKPNGVAWLSSYHLDVSLLMKELREAEKFRLLPDEWEKRWLV